MTHGLQRIRIFLVCLLFVFFAGCSDNGAPATPPEPPAPSVTVITLAPQDLFLTQEFAGHVEGRQSVQVRAQVSGLLKRRAYAEGSWVEQGQLLFEIDDARYRALEEQAASRLARAQARLQNAERDLNRSRPLAERNSISARELDAIKADYGSARADVGEAEAGLQEARLQLALTMVQAPISGYAGMAEKSEGALINATSSEGSLLVDINDTSSVRVLFAVPEALVRRTQRYMTENGARMEQPMSACLLLDKDQVYPHQGGMEFGNAVVRRETGTMRARAVFPNPERSLFPGQIVRIRMRVLRFPGALAVPQTALAYNAEGASLAVVNDKDAVSFCPVKVEGPLNAAFLILPGSAVRAGDRVIVEGINKVRPGMTVKPRTKKEDTPQGETRPAGGEQKETPAADAPQTSSEEAPAKDGPQTSKGRG